MPYSILDDITVRVRRLPASQQEQALVFVRQLELGAEQRLAPDALARLVGTITPADLALMAEAIEAGCERMDAADW